MKIESASLRHFLTFDVEHWYQGYRVRGSNDHYCFAPRDHVTVEKLLRLLQEYNFSATFFTTGVFAEEFSTLIEEIHAAGHELASHSYDHKLVHTFNDLTEFKSDLKKSIEIIENISGDIVYGFRAPKWSLPSAQLEDYYEILVGLGLKYDSSLFPGIFSGNSRKHFHQIFLNSGATIWQFPASTYSFSAFNIPAAGGLWFRLFPLALSRLVLKRGDTSNYPQMLYLHPYDFDSECPRLKTERALLDVPFHVARNYNLKSTYSRLELILEEFQFCSIKDELARLAPSDESFN